jgi:hypothetical protein
VKKRTHKFRAIGGDVAGIVAASPTLTAAARRLGVNRSTIHRWIVDGKAPRPGRRRSLQKNGSDAQVLELQTPAAWAEAVRAAYVLSVTEQTLLRLAERALEMAHDDTQKTETRLAAMARFQTLVRQLDLEVESDGKAEAPADVRSWPKQIG